MSIFHTFNKAIIEKTREACRLNVILIGLQAAMIDKTFMTIYTQLVLIY